MASNNPVLYAFDELRVENTRLFLFAFCLLNFLFLSRFLFPFRNRLRVPLICLIFTLFMFASFRSTLFRMWIIHLIFPNLLSFSLLLIFWNLLWAILLCFLMHSFHLFLFLFAMIRLRFSNLSLNRLAKYFLVIENYISNCLVKRNCIVS